MFSSSFRFIHSIGCNSCQLFFHFSSHHTSQTTAAATNPKEIVIAAISLASIFFCRPGVKSPVGPEK